MERNRLSRLNITTSKTAKFTFTARMTIPPMSCIYLIPSWSIPKILYGKREGRYKPASYPAFDLHNRFNVQIPLLFGIKIYLMFAALVNVEFYRGVRKNLYGYNPVFANQEVVLNLNKRIGMLGAVVNRCKLHGC